MQHLNKLDVAGIQNDVKRGVGLDVKGEWGRLAYCVQGG